MEALVAIGLASNILQFVDFSAKIINGGREIHDSLKGMTEENESLASITSKMKELSSKLLPQTGRATSEEEKALSRVAAECNILSDQILGLLGKLKPKDSNSKRQIAKAMFANLCSEREKAELEKRLASCRSQLNLQMNHLLSSDTKAQFVQLINQSQGNADTLHRLESGMEQLQQGVQVNSLSDEAQSQMQKLLDIPEEAHHIIAQQRIIEALSFSDMQTRFEAISEAHRETFEWIFQDVNQSRREEVRVERLNAGRKVGPGSSADTKLTQDSRTEPTETEPYDPDGFERKQASNLLNQWLATGDGVFHISGKLGSGKSTLMKFLSDHPQTLAKLQNWAGTRKLIFAKFFFWKPGSTLQKSLIGLFRSLLHDTLRNCPELLPTVFEDQWKSILAAPWQVHTKIGFSNKEVKTAFSRLIENYDAYRSHCFCLFIDGLDEYEETTEADYRSLVDLISKWTEKAPDFVKLCVSSRENNVFLSAFSEGKRIRLQDLTMVDMKRYINDKLKTEINEELEYFVKTIVQKSSGIFLWVALVVQTLRRLIDDGHEPSSLKGELDTLPEELEDLFEYLLDALPKPDRKRAYQLFAMVLELQNIWERSANHGCLTPFSYSFLNDVDSNPRFAQGEYYPYHAMALAKIRSRTDKAHKNINGFCKGLLVVVKGMIGFTHRSVPEYFERTKDLREMSEYLKSFNVAETISQLLLAEIRATTFHTKNHETLAFLSGTIIRLRIKHGSDRPPFSFLECLTASGLPDGIKSDREGQYLYWSSLTLKFSIRNEPGIAELRNTILTRFVFQPIHILASLGHWEYLEWKLHNQPEVIDSDYKIGMLLVHVYGGIALKVRSEPRQKISSFNPFAYLLSIGTSTEAKLHKSQMTACLSVPREFELTFWEHFVFDLARHIWVRYGSDESDYLQPCQLQIFSDSIVCFLQYGADPELRLYLEKTKDLFLLHLERKACKDINFVRLDRPIKVFEESCSFRQLIKCFKFENEEFLLQFLDEKIREREYAREVKSHAGGVDQARKVKGWKAQTESDTAAPLGGDGLQKPNMLVPESGDVKTGAHGHEKCLEQGVDETEGGTSPSESAEGNTAQKQDAKDSIAETLEPVEGICKPQKSSEDKVPSTEQGYTFELSRLQKSLPNPISTFCLGILFAVLILRILQ